MLFWFYIFSKTFYETAWRYISNNNSRFIWHIFVRKAQMCQQWEQQKKKKGNVESEIAVLL